MCMAWPSRPERVVRGMHEVEVADGRKPAQQPTGKAFILAPQNNPFPMTDSRGGRATDRI